MLQLEYMLEVSLCWFVFFAFYHFLLRKETFFNTNRAFLLLVLGVGLVLPLLRPVVEAVFTTSPAYSISLMEWTGAVVETENVANSSFWTTQNIILSAYLIGVLVFTSRFLYHIFQIYQIKRSGQVFKETDYTLIQTASIDTPFSFGHWLFIPSHMELSNKDTQKIIHHELVHIKEKHSLDIVLVEILTILFWFNPFLIFFQKALKEVHEYAADKVVLRSVPVKSYGQLLLQQAFPNIELPLVHNFNQTQLKNRIAMMTRKPSSKSAMWKYLIIAPVLFAMSIVFSSYTYSSNEVYDMGDVDAMPYIASCKNENKDEQTSCSNLKLMTFVYNNVKYPEEARKKGVEGMAVISFVVAKDGSMKNIKIAKDLEGGCGKAALAATQALASSDLKWAPGIDEGKAVDVELKLPVKFKLAEEGEKKDKQ